MSRPAPAEAPDCPAPPGRPAAKTPLLLPLALPLQVSGPISLRAEVDIGLATQLRRLLQVSGPLRLVSPLGQTAPVDPPPLARPLPRLAGVFHSLPRHHGAALLRSPLLRGLRVVAPEGEAGRMAGSGAG